MDLNELRERVRRAVPRRPTRASVDRIGDDRDTAEQVRSRLERLNRQLLQDGDTAPEPDRAGR